MTSLGRLEKVELRQAWTSESTDFTPWLAQEDNLRLLGDAIGVDLELEAQEKQVGPFRADILCKDGATDQWVLIENQLERTDHSHLGQLLTYAAGLNAVTIVWIAQRFTDEHRAALDWLNERTDDHINLFGLEIELWRIGNSPIAPKFNVICKPNEWSRTVQQAAASSGEITEHKQLQLRFWTAFKQFMETQGSSMRCQKPNPQHWMNHAIGRTGSHLSSNISSWNSRTGEREPEIRVDLWLTSERAKQEFATLKEQASDIEADLGFEPNWHNPEEKARVRIYTREDADFTDEKLWPTQFQWLKERLEKMHRVFAPRLRKLAESSRDIS
jgi:hypothetical protein